MEFARLIWMIHCFPSSLVLRFYPCVQVVAAGAAWHKACFTCGDGGGVYGCAKRLSLMDGYSQYGGWPFCKGCYTKAFLQGGAMGID